MTLVTIKLRGLNYDQSMQHSSWSLAPTPNHRYLRLLSSSHSRATLSIALFRY